MKYDVLLEHNDLPNGKLKATVEANDLFEASRRAFDRADKAGFAWVRDLFKNVKVTVFPKASSAVRLR